MKFRLNKNKFNILKENVIEAMDYVKNIKENEEHIKFEICDEDVLEVQLLINDEIVLNGMDNQDTVNQLGIELYAVYDEILYQKKNQ